MTPQFSVALPDSVFSVVSLAVDSGRGAKAAWAVDSNGKLWRVDAAGAKVVEVKDGQKEASATWVATDGDALLLVIDDGPDSVAGRLSGGTFSRVDLRNEPRRIAKAGAELWYTATDTSLRRVSITGQERAVAGQFNTVGASPNGAFIAAKRTPSDEVVVARPADEPRWSVKHPKLNGELAAVRSSGALILLELAAWTGGEPPNSTLFQVARGKKTTLLEAPIVQASGSDMHVAVALKKGGQIVIELYEM